MVSLLACPKCGSTEQLATVEALIGYAECEVTAGGEVVHLGYTAVDWDSQESVEPLTIHCHSCSWAGPKDELAKDELTPEKGEEVT